MEYLIGTLICLLYFKYYVVDGDVSRKKIDHFLKKNNLIYVNHTTFHPNDDVKKLFLNDVNPFIFLFYGICYYKMFCKNFEGENVIFYMKWYKPRAIFNKSKLYFIQKKN